MIQPQPRFKWGLCKYTFANGNFIPVHPLNIVVFILHDGSVGQYNWKGSGQSPVEMDLKQSRFNSQFLSGLVDFGSMAAVWIAFAFEQHLQHLAFHQSLTHLIRRDPSLPFQNLQNHPWPNRWHSSLCHSLVPTGLTSWKQRRAFTTAAEASQLTMH